MIILTISTESFGQGMLLYTLTNKNGVTLKATDFGARIVALDVPLTKNESRSLVLGFPQQMNICLKTYILVQQLVEQLAELPMAPLN